MYKYYKFPFLLFFLPVVDVALLENMQEPEEYVRENLPTMEENLMSTAFYR